MKTSRVFAALLVLAMLLSMLAGCGADSQPTTTADNCEHIWYSATCDAPKTCSICGKVEGTKLPHQWTDADCDTPKRCYLCNATDGEALGHQWGDGDCENARVCTVCNKAEGEAPGHDWAPATTEAPKTCKVCGKTEGEKIQVDSRFQTANCKHLFGVWSSTYDNDLTSSGLEGVVAKMKMTLEFCNDGTLISATALADPNAFAEDMIAVVAEMYYELYETQYGVTRDQLDLMLSQQGMTMEDLCGEQVSEYINAFQTTTYMVYYVEDGKIYAGNDWESEMVPDELVLDGEQLIMIIDDGEDVIYTR